MVGFSFESGHFMLLLMFSIMLRLGLHAGQLSGPLGFKSGPRRPNLGPGGHNAGPGRPGSRPKSEALISRS